MEIIINIHDCSSRTNISHRYSILKKKSLLDRHLNAILPDVKVTMRSRMEHAWLETVHSLWS